MGERQSSAEIAGWSWCTYVSSFLLNEDLATSIETLNRPLKVNAHYDYHWKMLDIKVTFQMRSADHIQWLIDHQSTGIKHCLHVHSIYCLTCIIRQKEFVFMLITAVVVHSAVEVWLKEQSNAICWIFRRTIDSKLASSCTKGLSDWIDFALAVSSYLFARAT